MASAAAMCARSISESFAIGLGASPRGPIRIAVIASSPARRWYTTSIVASSGVFSSTSGGRLMNVPAFPRRQDPQQRREDAERQNHQRDCRQYPFTRREPEFVCRVAEKTLREQLTAN